MRADAKQWNSTITCPLLPGIGSSIGKAFYMYLDLYEYCISKTLHSILLLSLFAFRDNVQNLKENSSSRPYRHMMAKTLCDTEVLHGEGFAWPRLLAW